MRKLKLPFWLGAGELAKLCAAAQAWWETVQGWLHWPLHQMDPEHCHLTILDLLAWQRDITRFSTEPEPLYRLRVKYAFIKSVDAGSTAGMKRTRSAGVESNPPPGTFLLVSCSSQF